MKPKYIVIHHTAVSYIKNPDQWKATENYHKSKGWGTGGYNYEVSKDGGVHKFREEGAWTAAQYQKKMNDGRAVSICLDGNFDIEDPTVAQKRTVRALIAEISARWGIDPKNVLKHRDVANYKSCPGNRIPDDVYNYFMSNVVNIELVQEKGSPKIYLKGKDGKYHHIVSEEVFKAFFGGFGNVNCSVVDNINPKDITFKIQ